MKAASALVVRASAAVIRCERVAMMGLLGWLLLLVLLNVGTRLARVPLYWVDEAAVYSVVWLTFVGASAMTRLRMDFAVTLLTDRLGPRHAQWVKSLSTLFVFLLGCALVAMCWAWMDPVGIAKAGFDAKAYAGDSFNFLYTERTQTLAWPTWVIQLVLPIFALTFSLHALANLVEDLGWQERLPIAGFPVAATADEVN